MPESRPPESRPPETGAPNPPGWRALLIGIDHYRHVGDLGGAVNDVERVRAFLETAAGVPAERITTLTDEQATRQAILDALLALADGDLAPDDQVLVHYSGHGAHMRDPRLDAGPSPSGFIESLVAHDSGRDGAWNIPDYILGALLDRIAAHAHLTVVLDCCHSGHGTRDELRVRQVDADARVPPPDLDAPLIAALGGPAVAFSGQGMRYTVLAACRDRERAVEHDDFVDGKRRPAGLFTTCLYTELVRAPVGSSYAEVMRRVAPEVTARAPHQHPQWDGRGEREVFGGADVRVDAFAVVVEVTADGVSIGGGSIIGLAVDDRLALYPATVRTRAQLAADAVEPLAIATVTRVRPTRARARVDGVGEAPPPPLTTLLHARAVLLDPPVDGGRVRFVIEPGGGLPPGRPRDAPWREAVEGEAPDITVVLGPQAVRIRDAAGALRLPPRPPGRWVWDALEKMARFDRLSRLNNRDRGSALQGALDMQIVPWRPRSGQADDLLLLVGGQTTLLYRPGADSQYTVHLHNRAPRWCEAQLLLLNNDFGVMKLYPAAGDQRRIDPGKTLVVGQDAALERIETWLPDTPYWVRSDNVVMAITTPEPVDVDLLTQDGLDGAEPPTHRDPPEADTLEGLLLDCARGRRMLRRRAPEDWGVSRLAVTVLRIPPQQRLEPGLPARLDIGLIVTASALTGYAAAGAFDRVQACRGQLATLPRPPLERLGAAGLVPVPSPALGDGESPLVLLIESTSSAGGRLSVESSTFDAPLMAVTFDAAGYTALGEMGPPGRVELRVPTGVFELPVLFVRRA